MGFHSGAEYVALPAADQTWIINNVLPVGGKLNIYGKPKTGKSMIGLQLASAIASGKKEWLSFGISTHGPVAYFQLDTPRSLWMDRVKHLRNYGVDFSNVHFADSQDSPYPFDILQPDSFFWLRDNVGLMNPKPPVLIIDTIREMHSGSEDESAQMKKVIAQVETACPGTAVVFVSHSRKGNPQNFGMQPDLMDENRGSGYVAGRMDCVLWLREKAIHAKGRALPETEIAVEMHPDSYEILLADRFVQDAILITEGSGLSLRQMATTLQERYPKKSFEACRSTLRRICPATV